MDASEKIDYLAVGHICHDVAPDGFAIGGAAAYAGGLASAFGCRTAVVTSSAAEDNWRSQLPEVMIHKIPADKTTVFENVYTPFGRVQTIHSVAEKIQKGDIPANWRQASIVHVAPIANEVDPEVVSLFTNSVVGVAPQGWMRRWEDNGRVIHVELPDAERIFRQATVVFISEEDLFDSRILEDYRHWARLLVMTEGSKGCTIFIDHETYRFPGTPVPVVDTTGAGDIFATAFLIRYHQTGGSFMEAARFANNVAAHSIRYHSLEAKVDAVKNFNPT